MNLRQQRQARTHQASHRGSKRSYKTELENLQLLLCWEAEELSEGQVSAMLELDRVSIRKMRLDAIAAGLKLADALDAPRQARLRAEIAARKAACA